MFNNKEQESRPYNYKVLNVYNLFNYLFYFLVIIYIFIPNSYIESSRFLVEFSSIFDDIFPGIQSRADISDYYGLYYKMKLGMVLGIFIGGVLFLPMIYIFTKIYLSSLGISKIYYKKYLCKYTSKSPSFDSRISSSLFFVFITVSGFYFFYFKIISYSGGPTDRLYYGTSFGVSLIGIPIFSFFIFSLFYFIFELFVYFYKLKNRDKFLSKEEFELYFIVNERYKKIIETRYKKTFCQKFKNILLFRIYDEKIFENISTQEEKELKEKIQKEVKLELEKKLQEKLKLKIEKESKKRDKPNKTKTFLEKFRDSLP